MKYFLTYMLTIIVVILALAVISPAQDPVTPAPLPQRDFHYNCATLATSALGPQFTLDFQQFPFPQIGAMAVNVDPATPTGDTTPPVISLVGLSGVPVTDVLTNNAKLTLANGAAFTVAAGDDVSVMYYRMWVDGAGGPMEGDGIHPFGSLIYLRWNTINVTSGIHTFKLIVWDAALNASKSKDWTMLR